MSSGKYTNQQIIDAVPNCTSVRQLLLTLGVAARGGNYKTVLAKLKSLGIDHTHFTGQGHNKGKILKEKQSHASHHLFYGSTITSYSLKLRLIRDGYFTHQCSCCGLSEWQSQPIPLELDHIDGDNLNNAIENLRLLCPNCHALTPTYRGKNQKRAK